MDMNPIPSNRLKQISFFILLVGLGFLIFTQLKIFIPSFLGSVTFYVMMRRSMITLVYKRKWRRNLSASLLIFVSILIVLIPVWVLVSLLAAKVTNVIQHSNQILATLKHFADQISEELGVQLITPNTMDKASSLVANTVPNVLGATFNTLTSIALMYFILFFMLIRAKEMEAWLMKYIPLKDENVLWLGKDLQELVYNNAIGVPLIAFAQGVVGLGGYLLLGVPDALFWFVITTLTSMVPFIGAALAYVPLGILLWVQGPAWKGIAVLIYGFGVIGLVDNVFRFVLQKKLGDVHPLITIFGVILGVNLFGFIGLIFGPILISLFVLLVRIYVNEFGSK